MALFPYRKTRTEAGAHAPDLRSRRLRGIRAKRFCTKAHVDEVERDDLLAFATDCKKQGQQGKSVYNKLVVISQVLKQHGKTKLLNAADWPSFVETVRPIYEDADLAKLFKACTPQEEARFKFYLMSGFRDAEGRFVIWRDMDFNHLAVRVTASSVGWNHQTHSTSEIIKKGLWCRLSTRHLNDEDLTACGRVRTHRKLRRWMSYLANQK